MVASIGKIVSPAQGVSYYERDGYYARDDPAHREASAWAGKGAAVLGVVKLPPARRSGSVAGVTGACVCDGSGVKWPRVG